MTKVMEQKIYKELQDLKKELKFIKQYISITATSVQDEVSEDELLRDLKAGEKEYREGKCENIEDFLTRDYPDLAKDFHAQVKANLKIHKKLR